HRSLGVFERPRRHSHRAQAPQRRRRGAHHSAPQRQERLPVGHAAARHRARPRDRRDHPRRRQGAQEEQVMEIDLRRRFFAEELEAVCKLRSPRLIEALATVPREAFLPPGPWTGLTEMDFLGGASRTGLSADATPARVNHNTAVAIEPARQLFNGQPGTLAVWIDALELAPGARVLHVGAGLRCYSALIAQCAGPGGRLLAIEADEALASAASRNLVSMQWAEVRHGDATDLGGECFDAIPVNAGVRHPLGTLTRPRC